MTQEIQDRFQGIAPKISPKKLSKNLAQVAENTRFDGGKLRPFKTVADHLDVADITESIHYQNPVDGWIEADTPRHYTRPFLPADQYKFTYFTDGVKPRYRVAGSDQEYNTAIERPAAPPISVVSAGDTTVEVNNNSQSYVVCWVDGHGRVGPTSLPSASVTVEADEGVVQITRPALPSAQWFSTGAVWRVFRSNRNSANVADYQYVAEAPISTTSIQDVFNADELTYVAFSDLWVGPPDAMQGLALAAGDFSVGYTDNEVYASEPRVPHAWPYSWGFQEQVKGIAVINAGVLVVTDAQPWLLAGSDPNNIQKVPIESDAACVSTASLVDMGGVALYAGRDGLYAGQGSQVTPITIDLFNAEQWAAYQPETIRAFQYEQYYVGFYGDVADGTGFLFDPQTQEFVTIELAVGIHGGWFNPYDGKVYVLYQDGTDRRIGVFNDGALLTMRWRSRVILHPDRVSYSAVRIEADNYPITLRVWSDDQLDTATIEDKEIHRLPGGFRAKEWVFEVEGTAAIDMVCLASSAGEIV